MKCTLSADINNCPFCNKEDLTCKNENKCAFKEDIKHCNKEYVRQERWYEKYYRKK